MKQLSVGILMIFCGGLFFSCQPSGTVQSSASSAKEEAVAADESAAGAGEKIKIETDPRSSVVLRDEARVWMNNNGTISAEYVAKVDMGTELIYLGEDEMLKTGDESYMYSRVKLLGSGTEGWVSTVRLAKNSVSAVVLESCRLYRKPLTTEPLDRILPAGQIVAVSQETGIVNGFVEIIYSYYEGSRLTAPEHLYIPYDHLTTNGRVMEVARLVLKAFRNPGRMSDFFNLSMTLNSVFKISGASVKTQTAYLEPDRNAARVDVNSEIKVLAVNPYRRGSALPWYPAIFGGEFIWVPSDDVSISPSLIEKNEDSPALEDHSHYGGTGLESINLLQGLALRKMVRDGSGEKSLVAHTSLGMGETAYFTGEEFSFNNIPYLHLEFSDGTDGWSSRSYIAVDANLAVSLKEDIPIYTKPDDSTVASDLRLQKYQLIALHNGEENGFVKISYISRDDDTLHKELYIKADETVFSTGKNDVDAAMLLDHYLKEEKEGQKALYLKEAASIDSFMQEDLKSRFF